MMTLQDLKDRVLATRNPDDILEILDISAEELLDRFEDKLEERFERISEEFEDETSDESYPE